MTVLARMRRRWLEAALPIVSRHGWTAQTLRASAKKAGLDTGEQGLAAPNGAKDLIALWASDADAHMHEIVSAPGNARLKIRERVTLGIQTRIAFWELDLAPDNDFAAGARDRKSAARRTAQFLAIPCNLGLGADITWRSADAIWRALGDQSLDGNYYSKRAIVSSVLAATALIWAQHEDDDEAWAFLDRRIADVMRFEGWKYRQQQKKHAKNSEQSATASEAGGLWDRLARWRYG